jgi:hypothetical protein
MIMAMKMSAEASGEKFEDPRTKRPPKTRKGPSNEMDAMAMDTKGFANFLAQSETDQNSMMM